MRTTPWWGNGQLNQATDLGITITSYPFGEGGIFILWAYGVEAGIIDGSLQMLTSMYVK